MKRGNERWKEIIGIGREENKRKGGRRREKGKVEGRREGGGENEG